jgi:hypothetical protein
VSRRAACSEAIDGIDEAEVEEKFTRRSKQDLLASRCEELGIADIPEEYWPQAPHLAPSEAVPLHPPAPSG